MGVTSTATFGSRIRQARLEAGLSRGKLARALDVSERAVAYWEDEGRTPRAEYFPLLAEVTGKPIAWLVNGEAA